MRSFFCGSEKGVFERGDAGRVLVVEGQAVRRAEYVLTLIEAGYAVRALADPRECRVVLTRDAFDVVIVDLAHPSLGPRDLPRQLGTAGRAGLLGVAAGDQPEQRIAAIEAGCDDLIALPVHPGELRARISALIRRRLRHRRYAVAGLQVDLDARTLVTGSGARVVLTRGEFTLLALLLQAGGAVVAREALAAAVARRGDTIDPRTADALVRRIRRKLEPAVEEAIIATVQGTGYRLAMPPRPAE